MKTLTGVLLSMATIMVSTATLADPIYIHPGQCILINGQQICAMQTSNTTNPESSTIYACRYGQHADAEVSDLKSYALLQIVTRPDGKKIETSIRNYGMNGKTECEKDAERLRAK